MTNEFKSKYFHSSTEVLQKLNKVSPSFCLAKWYNVSIHIPTGQTHSCYHPRSHTVPLEEIAIDVSSLHNTKYKKEQRKAMLSGQRPDECHFCWEIEDNGDQLSDRAYRSGDIFQDELIQEAIELGSTGNPIPRYMEVNFNQACNFKCMYCSPHLSTEWQKEVEKNGYFVLADRNHNNPKFLPKANNGPDNPYLEAFWSYFPEVYPNLNTFRMTGGEPLMDKNTYNIFRYIEQNPKLDLNLSITSNCCPPKLQWSKFMDSLKAITLKNRSIDHFMLYCSLDSVGSQAEYIRNGMNFPQLKNNVEEYISDLDHHSLSFINTFNVLSYTGLHSFLEFILKLRKAFNGNRQLIWFDIPQLDSPSWFDSRIFPEMVVKLEDAKDFMIKNSRTKWRTLTGFYDFEISKVQRLIDRIRNDPKSDIDISKVNFYMYIREYDRRNNWNFLDYFPEYENFYFECQKLYESKRDINGQ